ncbi:DUF3466 family protein [Aliidiomarina sanyensis]|uniref:DUF3466 domain-containing protein n=1 Tax=Aliidiomarina sanyensis TaxID=1249555 RepID=A0A432WRZ1_9GAMM|nr:DUF3466 family protein [Aliidiomarina sanyensis]RUO36489.1 hypothetical protein CWE11_01355 [Aliidiomarina sanyensis]
MRIKTISVAIAAVCAAGIGIAHAGSIAPGYTVVKLDPLPNSANLSPRALNDLGHVVGSLSELTGQNIRLDLLDPEDFPDIEDLNNPSERELRLIRDRLLFEDRFVLNPEFQKLAIELGFYFDGQVRELDGFDVIDDETGLRTDSADFRALGLNNSGITVGQVGLPYFWLDAEDEDGDPIRFYTRDSFPVGAWTDGTTYRVLRGNDDVVQGGMASAVAINDNHLAVGYGSERNGIRMNALLELCQTPDEDADNPDYLEPLEVCLWRFWFNNSGQRMGLRTPITDERAFMWQLDANGEVIEQRSLGKAFDPDEDAEDGFATARYKSIANDVSNMGHIVGTSERVLDGFTLTRATWFSDEGPINLREGSDDTNSSHGIAVNDQGIVVGYSNRVIAQQLKPRLFFIDLNDPSLEATYPTGFVQNTGWRPRAINNAGLVVGTGEPVFTQATQPRSVGFVYDIAADEVTDLNRFLPCDSNLTIVDAVDINDAGEILALALERITIEEGETSRQFTATRSLILQPSSTENPACPGRDDLDTGERRGASVSPLWLGLFSLIALITLRRRTRP